MDLSFFHELQPVLDRTQEPVGQRQRSGVTAVDVAGLGQLSEGRQGGWLADQRIRTTVHQLQQLHGELDVPDSAAAPLDLPVRETFPRDELLRPSLHGF